MNPLRGLGGAVHRLLRWAHPPPPSYICRLGNGWHASALGEKGKKAKEREGRGKEPFPRVVLLSQAIFLPLKMSSWFA